MRGEGAVSSVPSFPMRLDGAEAREVLSNREESVEMEANPSGPQSRLSRSSKTL